MNITIEVAEGMLKKLEEKAKAQEKSLEETILEALLHRPITICINEAAKKEVKNGRTYN